MTSIQSITAVASNRSYLNRTRSTLDDVQAVFSAVLHEVGKEGWVSANPLPAEADTKKEMVESWNQWFNEFSHRGYSYLVEGQATRAQKEQSLSELKDGYQKIMLRAYEDGGYADPVAFAQKLSVDDLAIVQKINGLADRIDVTKLSSESALNLLIPGGAKVDENRDGLTSIGAAHTLGFPNSRTPQTVKEAWEKATVGLDPAERAMREIEVISQITFRNMYANPDGTIRRIVEPGDPDWINPHNEPGYSFEETASQQVAYYEYFRFQMPVEQYHSGKAFWSSFRDLLKQLD